MRIPIAATAFFFLCAGLAAKDDKAYESKEGRYKVVFPGAPTLGAQKLEEGDLNSASVEVKGGGFMVIYTDLSAEKLKKAKPKDLFNGSEKNLVDSFKAKIASSKDVEFGKEKYPARQLVAEAKIPDQSLTITVRMTLILAGNRLYQVFVFGPKDLTTGGDANRFFDSFEIVK